MLDLNNMPSYTARLPKTAHDMSQSLSFTCSTGMELPIFKDILIPGDKIHFTGTEFARINNIIKPALCKVDFHLDYFFVPLTVICNFAGSWMWKTDDLINGSYQPFTKEDWPHLDLNKLFDATYSTGGFSWTNLSKGFRNMPFANNGSAYIAQGFDSNGKGAFRLLDLLGYNPMGVFRDYAITAQVAQPTDPEISNPVVTPWFLSAYQAIHQLWYRNDDREPKSYCYNFDKWQNQDEILDLFQAIDLVSLRYVQRNKDYFQSIKVSPLASPTSLLNVQTGSENTSTLLSKVNNFLASSANDNIIIRKPNGGDSALGEDSTTTALFGQNSNKFVSTATIRSMFAVEKMLRVIGRSEKTYEAQVLAHMGYKVPHDVLHNITHIGHDMATMEPEVVIAQSDTFNGNTGQSLGSVGGQGSVKFTGKKHHFEAPCHGVFMVIATCVPRPRYYGGFDKLNVLNNPLDFYQPEYDKLGMQPLYNYEFDNQFIGASNRIGWQFRYEQFKRKYDRTTLFAMQPTGNNVNEMSAWILSQYAYSYPLLQLTGSEPYRLMADGKMLDNISVVKYNGQFDDSTCYASPWLTYQYDPFICDFTLKCTKFSIMSKYGEPELDI